MSNTNNLPKITLDRERSVRFTLTAIKTFKELTGKSIFNLTKFDELEESEMIALIYCGLLHEDPDLTIDQVGNMVDMSNLLEVATVLNESMSGKEAKEEAGPLSDTDQSSEADATSPKKSSGT